MKKLTSHYDTLEVSEDASKEVILGAYRYLSQKWHPDKNLHDTTGAGARMKDINAAYEVLSNPANRAEYDQWLREQRVMAGRDKKASSQQPGNNPDQTEDNGLRCHYAGAIAKQGRFLQYVGGFVFVLIGIAILGAIFDGFQPYLSRHPAITLIALVVLSGLVGNQAIEIRRRELLDKTSTEVLEVMYAESMRKRLMMNVVGSIAGVFLAVVFIIGYSKMKADRPSISADPSNVSQMAATTAPASAGTNDQASPESSPSTHSAPVSAPAPGPVLTPTSEALKPTEITVKNKCDAEIRLAILRFAEDSTWKVDAWDVPASSGGTLSVEDKPLSASGRVFYYYAESTDGNYVWSGTADDGDDLTYPDEKSPLRFQHVRIPPDLGTYQLTINCPNV